MEVQRIVQEPQHHAYLVFGYAPGDLCVEQDAGVFLLETEKGLGIDEVRELQQYAFQSDDAQDRKIVLGASNITHQAQNALLKMMEEVGGKTFFFLCLPQGTDVLGTLLSRCYIIDRDSAGSASVGQSEQFAQFIAASVKERLVLLDAIWDMGEGVRHSAILRLLQDFEQHIHQHIQRGAAEEHVSIMRCRRAVGNLRDGIYNGALHKGTLQVLAFC
ncbi:MAG: hypothetical protein OXB96_02040 [Candidatus Kaiserbacteria bacterium]|nr:hypothetical protein [Candidatus Kaiserbacteria bacterium]